MKKLGLFVLLFFIQAHAQSTLEKCQAGACYGFGAPSGNAANGFIYQDVSQSPPALYCPKNGAWVACGGSGGGASTPATTLLLKGNNSANGVVAATPGTDYVVPSGTAANLSGTPALPNGTTATTQTVGDNTAKLATDAFVLANAGGTVSNPLTVTAEWPFNDGSGTSVHDITGNGHDGTFGASSASPSWGPYGVQFLNSTTATTPAQNVLTNIKTWTSFCAAYEIYVGLPTTGTGSGVSAPYNTFPTIFGPTTGGGVLFFGGGSTTPYPQGTGAFEPSMYNTSSGILSTASQGFGQRHIACVVAGSPDAYYVDGNPVPLTVSGSSTSAITTTGFYEFGSGAFGDTNGFRGTILYSTLSTSAWTPSQVIQENNYILGKITARPLVHWTTGTTRSPQTIFIGDSLWAGRNGTGVWTNVLTLNNTYNVINRGVSGINMVDIDLLAESTWLQDVSPNAKEYCLFEGGSNDLANTAPAETVWGAYVSAASKARALGCVPVASTIISRTGQDANIAAANVLIRARWKQAGFAALLDNWERAEFATGGSTNTTFYNADGTHLTGGTTCSTATGYGLFCVGASKVINTLDGSTPSNPTSSTATTLSYTDAMQYILRAPTGAATDTLVDCSWITGLGPTVVNNSAFTITMATVLSQTLAGKTTIPAGNTVKFTSVPTSASTGGCQWVGQ